MAQPASPAAAPSGAWQNEIGLYAAGVGMSGQAAIGSLGVKVDLSFSEILDQMEAAGMVAYDGHGERWGAMANLNYVGLAATKDLPLGGTAEADVDQTLFDAEATRRFAKGLQYYFGARVVDVNTHLELRPAAGADRRDHVRQTWVDPLVGLRYETPLGKRWRFVGRADIGGFDVGSHLAWQVLTHFDWKLSSHVGADFGYVLLDIDYHDGQGRDFFKYDIRSEGPVAALTFTF